MKIEGGLLSGLSYEPSESCSTLPEHPAFTLTTADLLRMAGSRARQDRLIAELEARFIAHYIFTDLDIEH
jgi:hypothetical protein